MLRKNYLFNMRTHRVSVETQNAAGENVVEQVAPHHVVVGPVATQVALDQFLLHPWLGETVLGCPVPGNNPHAYHAAERVLCEEAALEAAFTEAVRDGLSIHELGASPTRWGLRDPRRRRADGGAHVTASNSMASQTFAYWATRTRHRRMRDFVSDLVYVDSRGEKFPEQFIQDGSACDIARGVRRYQFVYDGRRPNDYERCDLLSFIASPEDIRADKPVTNNMADVVWAKGPFDVYGPVVMTDRAYYYSAAEAFEFAKFGLFSVHEEYHPTSQDEPARELFAPALRQRVDETGLQPVMRGYAAQVRNPPSVGHYSLMTAEETNKLFFIDCYSIAKKNEYILNRYADGNADAYVSAYPAWIRQPESAGMTRKVIASTKWRYGRRMVAAIYRRIPEPEPVEKIPLENSAARLMSTAFAADQVRALALGAAREAVTAGVPLDTASCQVARLAEEVGNMHLATAEAVVQSNSTTSRKRDFATAFGLWSLTTQELAALPMSGPKGVMSIAFSAGCRHVIDRWSGHFRQLTHLAYGYAERAAIWSVSALKGLLYYARRWPYGPSKAEMNVLKLVIDYLFVESKRGGVYVGDVPDCCCCLSATEDPVIRRVTSIFGAGTIAAATRLDLDIEQLKWKGKSAQLPGLRGAGPIDLLECTKRPRYAGRCVGPTPVVDVGILHTCSRTVIRSLAGRMLVPNDATMFNNELEGAHPRDPNRPSDAFSQICHQELAQQRAPAFKKAVQRPDRESWLSTYSGPKLARKLTAFDPEPGNVWEREFFVKSEITLKKIKVEPIAKKVTTKAWGPFSSDTVEIMDSPVLDTDPRPIIQSTPHASALWGPIASYYSKCMAASWMNGVVRYGEVEVCITYAVGYDFSAIGCLYTNNRSFVETWAKENGVEVQEEGLDGHRWDANVTVERKVTTLGYLEHNFGTLEDLLKGMGHSEDDAAELAKQMRDDLVFTELNLAFAKLEYWGRVRSGDDTTTVCNTTDHGLDGLDFARILGERGYKGRIAIMVGGDDGNQIWALKDETGTAYCGYMQEFIKHGALRGILYEAEGSGSTECPFPTFYSHYIVPTTPAETSVGTASYGLFPKPMRTLIKWSNRSTDAGDRKLAMEMRAQIRASWPVWQHVPLLRALEPALHWVVGNERIGDAKATYKYHGLGEVGKPAEAHMLALVGLNSVDLAELENWIKASSAVFMGRGITPDPKSQPVLSGILEEATRFAGFEPLTFRTADIGDTITWVVRDVDEVLCGSPVQSAPPVVKITTLALAVVEEVTKIIVTLPFVPLLGPFAPMVGGVALAYIEYKLGGGMFVRRSLFHTMTTFLSFLPLPLPVLGLGPLAAVTLHTWWNLNAIQTHVPSWSPTKGKEMQ